MDKISTDTTTPDAFTTGLVYIVDTSDSDVRITLSDKLNVGAVAFIKKDDDSNNSVIVDGGSFTIDGCEEIEIVIQDEAYMIVKFTDGWHVI